MNSTEYKHTRDMGEISGFGGGYEECCQNMLNAGVNWLNDHPAADPKFHGHSGLYGVILEDNQDAKDLTGAVIDAAKPDGATGAMHQAVISRVMVIKKNGWDWYCNEVRKHEQEQAESAASSVSDSSTTS